MFRGYSYPSVRQGEDRWVTVGLLEDRKVAVVWTARGDATRVVSRRDMKKDGNIVSYTAEELREMIARGEDQTDWARVDAMTERSSRL